MRKIFDLDLKLFGLRIWITLYFTGFGLETFWTTIYNRYFTGAGLANFDYNYYISRDLDFKVPGLRFEFQLLFDLLD